MKTTDFCLDAVCCVYFLLKLFILYLRFSILLPPFGVELVGPIHLKASRTHLNKFERNQVDEFFVEAVNIGELRRIK